MKTRLMGKQRFVNKHPENSLRIRFLRKIFPDAIFIHMIRDGWPTVASNYERTLEDPFRTSCPFGQFPKPEGWRSYVHLPLAEQFAHQWVDVIEHIRNDACELLGRDEYIGISYEEFCERPCEVVARLDDFWGSSAVLACTSRFPTRKSESEWRNILSPEQAAAVGMIIPPLNAELGYGDEPAVAMRASQGAR